MNAFLITMIVVSNVGLLSILYMMDRNDLVYKTGMAVLNDERYSLEQRNERFKRLPPYQKMMGQLFRFSWDDYLEGDKHEQEPGTETGGANE